MKIKLLIIILFSSLTIFSQEYLYPESKEYQRVVMMKINQSDTIVHTSFQPLRVSYVENLIGEKNIFYNSKRERFAKKMPVKIFWDKLLVDDLLIVKDKDLEFSINPLINYYNINLQGDSNYYGQNTRGFQVQGSLGEKFSFYTDFFENQAYFLPYIDKTVQQDFIVPGQGSWKLFGEDRRGRDYNYASGYLSYTPTDFFNIQIGHSKQFIGSGYRSLLLSDNSFVYPFAKFTVTKGKWQYVAMFTEFQSFKHKYYDYHYKKHGSFVYVNYSPISNVEFGFFEGIIWRTSDDSTYVKKIPALYFLPVPLVREAVYGLDGENNAILGLNTRIKVCKYGEIYGQFALDNLTDKNFDARYAYQTGVKIYDVFAEKINGQRLFLQAEYNFAKPYTYTQGVVHQAYTNYNAPLAHPLGAGFSEFVGIVNWNLYGFLLSYRANLIKTSSDTLNSNFGTNLLLSNSDADFMNTNTFIGQGNSTSIVIHSFSLAYIINPKINLQVFFTVDKRNYLNDFTKDDLFFVSFGVKNAIKNFYYDY